MNSKYSLRAGPSLLFRRFSYFSFPYCMLCVIPAHFRAVRYSPGISRGALDPDDATPASEPLGAASLTVCSGESPCSLMMLLTAPIWRVAYVGATRDPDVLREDVGAARGAEGARDVVGRRAVAPALPSPPAVRIARRGAPRSIAKEDDALPPVRESARRATRKSER